MSYALAIESLDVFYEQATSTPAPTSCGSNCLRACVDVTSVEADIVVNATATDSYGQVTSAERTYEVVDCPTVDLGAGISASIDDTTAGNENLIVGASCGNGGDTTPDATYRFVASTAGYYEATIDADVTGGDAPILVVREEGCGGLEAACEESIVNAGHAHASAIFFADVGEAFTLVFDGVDEDGFTLSVARLPACSDGVENDVGEDADGRVDYPEDPGCDSPTDDDETDPATPPVCADGADNDSDSFFDWPEDPSCVAASSTSETTAAESCASFVDVGMNNETVPLALARANFDHALSASCAASAGATAGADQVFRLVLTGDALVSFQSTGNVISVRHIDDGCAVAEHDVGCQLSTLTTTLPAGEVFVIVSRISATPPQNAANTLHIDGTLLAHEICDEQVIGDFPCAPGTECSLVGGDMVCDPPACSNGRDDDGDLTVDYNGLDTNNDNILDYPLDPGCEDAYDDTEEDECEPTIPAPTISPAIGTFDNLARVTMSTTEPNGIVRYTTDGVIPFSQSPAYRGTIDVITSTTFRAKTFVNGRPSCETTEATIDIIDTLAPYVVATSPRTFSTAAPTTVSSITATFNEAMLSTSFTSSTFTIVGAGTDRVFDTEDDLPRADTSFAYSTSSRTASMTFTGAPTALATDLYRVTLSTGVQDESGNALVSAYSWTFRIDLDTDGDGMSDEYETAHSFDPEDDADGAQDADSDGVLNRDEQKLGTDPRDANSDHDTPVVSDYDEDPDEDGLVHGAELAAGTDPFLPDTDLDQWPDGTEVEFGSNPLSAASTPSLSVVVSTPPVTSTSPNTGVDEAVNALPMSTVVSTPPVAITAPGDGADNAENDLEMSTTVGTPPVMITAPGPGDDSIAGMAQSTTVGTPPVTVTAPGYGTTDGLPDSTVIGAPPVSVEWE